LPVQYQGTKINVLDTPGYIDFIGEIVGALHVADAALVVVDGVNGVEVQTENYWRMADARALPRILFINKLDKEHADFDTVILSATMNDGFAVSYRHKQ
jgi:elongation factor G